MPLKLQVVSDLHIEFWVDKKKFNFVQPSADIIVLLGDTCCVGSDYDFATFTRFMVNEIIPKFKYVIIISGNHEYYFTDDPKQYPIVDMAACNKKLYEFCKQYKNCYYLNNNTITIGKYLLIGSTLWSWIPKDMRKKVHTLMNDYHYIYIGKNLITPDDVAKMHVRNVRYIKRQLLKAKKNKLKAIVLTHHKPYISDTHNPTSFDCCYESDLSSLFKQPLVLWVYGHTHVSDNITINGVKIVSNPKGYPYQRTCFKKNYTITI